MVPWTVCSHVEESAMSRPTRVLIVDDSALVRHRLHSLISSAPGMEVAGVAGNGQDCLDQLSVVQPDVISLDVWMPEMDGLATLRRIMQQRPTPVVMVSALTEAGAQVSLDALAMGAVDYLAKPSALSSDPENPFAAEYVRKLTVAGQVRSWHLTSYMEPDTATEKPTPRIRIDERVAWPTSATAADTERRGIAPADASGARATRIEPARSSVWPQAEGPFARPPYRSSNAPGRLLDLPLVVIGSSTGGPQVLDRLLSDLSEGVPAALLIVQHMPAVFTQSLATRLDRRTSMIVREASEGDMPGAGLVFVAKGGSHLTLGSDQRLHLDQTPLIHSVRPAVDRTLFSVAEHWAGRCLVVILTGMGVDGADGARALRAKGADVFAQDESTSIVYGMPRAVVEAGVASAVLPIDHMAAAIERWALTEAPLAAAVG